jgi:transposase
MGSTRRGFTEEYKAEAVAFVLNDGRAISEVAKNLGVADNTLGRWVKNAREAGKEQNPKLSESEREEVDRLRSENQQLQMEVAFAKKVANWFASQKP